ncbi:hypothetical protein FKP32DRAFT_1672018 [Trametes sanguinea]|nr:hypothetical protein FKP32DRAFT_1672018 [Trametes sanguinea]
MLKATTNSNANSALYAIFAAVAFIVGADDILLKVSGFVIASGASLSSCAGFLWTTQDSLMLAYQTEDQKGECIGIFWAGMVGAAAFLGKNYRNTASAFSAPTRPSDRSRRSLSGRPHSANGGSALMGAGGVTEIRDQRNAYLRDGSAHVLDEKMQQGYDITEYDAS